MSTGLPANRKRWKCPACQRSYAVPERWNRSLCDECEREQKLSDAQWSSVDVEFAELPKSEPAIAVPKPATADVPVTDERKDTADADRKLHVGAGDIGRLLFYLGLLNIWWFSLFRTAHNDVHNIGLLNERLVGMLYGVGLTVAGAALLAGRPIRLGVVDRIATAVLLAGPFVFWVMRNLSNG